MKRKCIISICSMLLATMTFSTFACAESNVVVTESGLAFLSGKTEVSPGSPVVLQIVPKDDTPINNTSGAINGYVNETIVQPDGSYRLVFSLANKYVSGNDYECHIDIAGQEYSLIPLVEGSLIEIDSKKFDRDTKVVTISGSLWDRAVFGKNLTLVIGTFKKTVASTNEGKFKFEFTMTEAGIDYGICNFVVQYANDATNNNSDSVEIVSAEPVLKKVRDNSTSALELKNILTNEENLRILGFDSEVLYGDGELTDDTLTVGLFEKLAKSSLKADTVANLKSSIQTAYSLNNMLNNPNDKNLRRCIELFNLGANDKITELYNAIDNKNELNYLFDLWKKSNVTNLNEAKAFYNESVLLTKLNNAEAWSNLMLFVNNNYSILGVQEQTSAEFWQSLILKSPFSSVSDFVNKYKNVLNSKNNSSTTSSSSGGGSGSSITVVSGVSTPVIQQNQETQDTTSTTIFGDVSVNHWAADAIVSLFERGIINGKSNGNFAPNDLITRAETAKIMCVSAELDKLEVEQDSFVDVNDNHWAKGYIEAVFTNELVKGIGNGKFGPEANTTREDMAVFCYRLLKIINPQKVTTEYSRNDLSFVDSNNVSDYAVNAVATMTKLGLINGKGNNKFDPKAYCTRAETAKMFYGVLNN